ncbi:MAG: LytTR family DNA-binding domain-containing protein [Brumimicrobium sp.]|nr:LytTR family DNA-binding domain-containing protein [Brumimicrobium sp.]
MNKQSLSAVLIDDSRHARNLLRLMLSEYAPEFRILGEADGGNKGWDLIQSSKPDVVFLDIEMSLGNGLQLADRILANKLNCSIVFTTAFNQYAVQAFRYSAIDYLLKPIKEDQLIETVQKLTEKFDIDSKTRQLESLFEHLKNNKPTKLCVPTLNNIEVINIEDVSYIQASGAYTQVFLVSGQKRLFSKNLKYFENALSESPNFIRPHRSYLVNINYVTDYSKSDGGYLVLKTNVQIPVSRDRKQIIQELLK